MFLITHVINIPTIILPQSIICIQTTILKINIFKYQYDWYYCIKCWGISSVRNKVERIALGKILWSNTNSYQPKGYSLCLLNWKTSIWYLLEPQSRVILYSERKFKQCSIFNKSFWRIHFVLTLCDTYFINLIWLIMYCLMRFL